MTLTFKALRDANIARLPQFKNQHGGLAHKEADGSDWTPAMWLQALVGELGEYAQVRIAFEAGQIDIYEYERRARKELADVQIYLDILAMRCLDSVDSGERSAPQELQALIAHLGDYANTRKKLDRGDYTYREYERKSTPVLANARHAVAVLESFACFTRSPFDVKTNMAHPTGVNLGEATREKFNEVSMRVGSDVTLDVS